MCGNNPNSCCSHQSQAEEPTTPKQAGDITSPQVGTSGHMATNVHDFLEGIEEREHEAHPDLQTDRGHEGEELPVDGHYHEVCECGHEHEHEPEQASQEKA